VAPTPSQHALRLYYGAIGMIDGILERILEKMGPETKTVATGGQARLIVAVRATSNGRRALTLEGLQMTGTEPPTVSDEDWFTTTSTTHGNRGALPAPAPPAVSLSPSTGRSSKLEERRRALNRDARHRPASRNGAPQGEGSNVNSLAFCAQAVLTEAQIMPEPRSPAAKPLPHAEDTLRTYLAGFEDRPRR